MKPHHWQGTPDPDKYFGFIYVITNTTNNRMYIGKKQYQFTKRVTIGKKRKSILAPSGWEYYTGSSTHLNKEIKELGIDNFTFMILHQATTRGMLYWLEVRELVMRNVLLEQHPTLDLPLYYNRQIPAVKFIPKGEYV